MAVTLSLQVSAQRNSNRLGLGVGALYERGLDVNLSYEREVSNHNIWEVFFNAYLKWDKCGVCGHVCPESFWNNYWTFEVGGAYKYCIYRRKNHFGNVRIGVGMGTDRKQFMGGLHLGYEHNYALRKGWYLYWQAKTELMLKGRDLFRTGVTIGIKIPSNLK